MYELHMGNEEHYLFSCYCNQPLERMTILEQKTLLSDILFVETTNYVRRVANCS